MSQLYQLFCDGLLDRGSAILSSTFMTSTPLEEEEDEAVHSGPGPAGPAASPSIAQLLRRNSESDHEDLGVEKDAEKQTPEYSVQGQVGSASESPPVDDPVGVNSPVAAVVSQGLQATPDKAVSSQKQQNKDIASQLSRHSVQRNPNVSPVDFVDRIIAAKRWDDAFAKKPKHIATCSQSSDESLVQHDEPAIEHRKVNDELSDSSETDFEGASEYYRSRQTQNSTTQQNSLGQNKNLPKKCSLSSNEESNMQLVMECISSENSSPNCLLNPECQNSVTSAARCRVYIRSKDGKAKSANRQPDPLPKNDHEGIQMRTAKVVLNDILNTQQAGIATADTNNFKSITVLNGVTAYVEVRSGHDNRSMGVRTQLRNLGAKVLEKFSSEITHVVFNEGAPSTLRKARKQGCHLVSVLWIDECKKLGRMVPEADHPPLDLHLYDEPGAYRKMKSFQPDFEEGKAEERQKKQLERLKARSQKATSSQQPSSQSSSSGEESSDDVSEETHPKLKIPDGVALKTFSIVLKKIDAIDSSGVSITSAKKKRKLLPLRQHLPASLSLDFDDFDPAVRVRPPFPYSQSSASQKKRNVPPRRIVKYQSSSSQNLRRRSSCFVRGTPCLSGSKPKKVKAKIPTMVCTFMHRREIDVVAAVIKQLGGWILEPTVSPRTTHVVCGDSKRTINLLRGIAHGCWIIRQEWVLRSLEAGHWLDEEPFELTEFPAVQQSRIARETLGAAPDIFSSAGCIYVSKDSTPPHFELVDLLQLCGGNVVKSVRQARVIIGPYLRPIDVTHVKEQWVLDSIQENMLQPTRNYRL